MKGSDQPGARRPTAVATFAAVLLLSVVSAVTASARPTSMSATHVRRASAALFDSRASEAPVAPGRAVLGLARRSPGTSAVKAS